MTHIKTRHKLQVYLTVLVVRQCKVYEVDRLLEGTEGAIEVG